ncbi:MAG: hypothetical protein E6J23_08280 [Chloroflexi bacterium]|nr:MAG: hypothetical protein E6J23_08280 [Chloroflexota bacterium]
MTDRDVVERVAKLFGRAMVRLRRRRPHHKLPYATTIKGTPAVRLMSAVRPFLGKTRQRQIDRAMASWQPRRGPVRSPIAMALSNLWTAQGAAQEACDRAWLAGLLEGEGSFITHREGRLSYPVIKVEMCELEVMERVADLLETRLRVEPSRAEGWRPTYVARIAGHRAADWMGAVRADMGLRRTAAIDAAIAGYHPIRLTDIPPICVVPGCGRPHRSRGLCHAHYMSWSRDVARGRSPRITPLR